MIPTNSKNSFALFFWKKSLKYYSFVHSFVDTKKNYTDVQYKIRSFKLYTLRNIKKKRIEI